jgi:hypothetical protein
VEYDTLGLGLNEVNGLTEEVWGGVGETDKEVIGVNDCKTELVILDETDWLTEEDWEFAMLLVKLERGEWDSVDWAERVCVMIGVPVNVIWYEADCWLEDDGEREPAIEVEPDKLVAGVGEFDRELEVVCE